MTRHFSLLSFFHCLTLRIWLLALLKDHDAPTRLARYLYLQNSKDIVTVLLTVHRVRQNLKLLIMILLVFSVSYGQLRTPQSIFGSLENISPLNDTNYFRAVDLNTKRLQKIKEKKRHIRLSQIKLIGMKNTLKSYAHGNKFYIPQKMDITDSFADGLNQSVPGYIPPSQSEAEVMKFFGDKMIQNWLSSAAVKSSSFGKAASTMEKAMKVEASISGSPAAPGQKTIDHRFSFQYLALQSQARMDYSGWTHAHFRHDSRVSETTMELSERVFKNKDLVLNHTKTPSENRSSLGVRWSW